MTTAEAARETWAMEVIARFVNVWLENYYKAEFDENAKPVLVGAGARRAMEMYETIAQEVSHVAKRQRRV